MKDIEDGLRSLSTPEPSEDLRTRIFGERPARRGWGHVLDVRVPLPWAAVFALATGLAGFTTAQLGAKAPPAVGPTAGAAVVQVKVVEASAARHVFDFTEPSQDFLPGNLRVRVETNNGA
jgi:hypothetical protein